MLSHRVFVVTQEVRNIGNGDATLQQDTCEGVPKSMRRGRVFELPSELENLVDFATPHIGLEWTPFLRQPVNP